MRSLTGLRSSVPTALPGACVRAAGSFAARLSRWGLGGTVPFHFSSPFARLLVSLETDREPGLCRWHKSACQLPLGPHLPLCA